MQRLIKGYALATALASSALTGCAGGSNSDLGPVAPAAPPARTVCATFYDDAQLKGPTLISMGPTDDSPTVPATFNDKMSSLAISPGCTVMVYADGNYGGQEVTFTQTTEIVPASINDQMSSYKCTCAAAGGAK